MQGYHKVRKTNKKDINQEKIGVFKKKGQENRYNHALNKKTKNV